MDYEYKKPSSYGLDSTPTIYEWCIWYLKKPTKADDPLNKRTKAIEMGSFVEVQWHCQTN